MGLFDINSDKRKAKQLAKQAEGNFQPDILLKKGGMLTQDPLDKPLIEYVKEDENLDYILRDASDYGVFIEYTDGTIKEEGKGNEHQIVVFLSDERVLIIINRENADKAIHLDYDEIMVEPGKIKGRSIPGVYKAIVVLKENGVRYQIPRGDTGLGSLSVEGACEYMQERIDRNSNESENSLSATPESGSRSQSKHQKALKPYFDEIETLTEQIPSYESVCSPNRRDLSHEDFQIMEDLGHGGQAVIKKARLLDSEAPPTVVALREPKAAETLTEEACEKFLNRGDIWQTVDSHERDKQRWERYDHIVGVIDMGSDPIPWIAMEYMDAGNLGKLLEKYPDGLPVKQALWITECVCKGLEIAEQLGMSHLDVKPENVLLKETAGWPWPKLADWGLARTLAKETGTVEAMSPKYAAPEQFDSSTYGNPDQLTDIYQTGALLHALLTGAPPVTGSNTEVVGTVLGDESIPLPSERRPEIPPVVDAAVGLALEQTKTDRHDSITDFKKALNAIRTNGDLPRHIVDRVKQ